jgi:hypothetical protein
VLVSNLKAVGNRLSASATGNLYGALMRSGRLDNWLVDRYATALSLEPCGEYQFALTGGAGAFSLGEVVTGGTSGAVGTLRFQHTEIVVTGSTHGYELGETVTGGTSGVTGTLVDFFANVLRVATTGTFVAGEAIGGGASGDSKIAASVSRRIYVGSTDDTFTRGETISGAVSGATAVVAAPYQTELSVGAGSFSNCATDAIVVSGVTTPTRLSISQLRGDTQAHGLRFNLAAGQRVRKAIVRDVALRNSTGTCIGFRVTGAGAIDEMVVDALDLTEWDGAAQSSITSGIVAKFVTIAPWAADL